MTNLNQVPAVSIQSPSNPAGNILRDDSLAAIALTPPTRRGIVVSWARHLSEVRAAQRLRYQVFAEVMGAQQGLDELLKIETAQMFQPLEATRAHLLSKLGRQEEARAAYDTAISLTIEPATRKWLQAQKLH